MTLFPDFLIWQLWSELELHISAELPEEVVSVDKFLERWPKIAKCFTEDEMGQGRYKIMLGM